MKVINKIKVWFTVKFKLTGLCSNIFYESGKRARGIVKYKNNYYFVSKTGEFVKNTCVYITDITLTNNLMRKGQYWTDENGIIKNPFKPVIPGLPTEEELAEKQRIGREILKNKAQISHQPKQNKHYKITEDRLIYDDTINYYLSKLWIRKVALDKICYDSHLTSDNKRDIINYIRHKCSNYDRILAEVGNYFNTNEKKIFHRILKQECLLLISTKYPSLKAMCTKMIADVI